MPEWQREFAELSGWTAEQVARLVCADTEPGEPFKMRLQPDHVLL